MMTTVLIILLAYPVVNVVLNTIACGMMSYALRTEEDFIASFIFGQTMKSIFYPLWIPAFGAIIYVMIVTIARMVRGRW